jgi:hypothetical protein
VVECEPFEGLTEKQIDLVELIAASIGYGLHSHGGRVVARRVYDRLREAGHLPLRDK